MQKDLLTIIAQSWTPIHTVATLFAVMGIILTLSYGLDIYLRNHSE